MYKAFIPEPLPSRLELDHELVQKAEQALQRLDQMGSFLPHIDPILAMYVRKEALLSSQIEGTQASLGDIFDYESKIPLKNEKDVHEVVNYIKALNFGAQRLEEFPVSLRLIKELHRVLMTGCRGSERTPGEFRTSQNWIGGRNLTTAVYVPPPPHEAMQAIGDLELYMHQDHALPEVVKCALIHYQFETIHPFLDGNGRTGRLLITFYLLWKKIMQKPLLYMSYYLKLHRQEYYDRLMLVRTKGDYAQWIDFFLKGIIWSSDSALETIRQILTLAETHKNLLIQKKVASAHAIALLDFLFRHPRFSVQEAAKSLKISYPTAVSLIRDFEKIKILREITGQKRHKRYVYWEYLELLSEGTESIASI